MMMMMMMMMMVMMIMMVMVMMNLIMTKPFANWHQATATGRQGRKSRRCNCLLWPGSNQGTWSSWLSWLSWLSWFLWLLGYNSDPQLFGQEIQNWRAHQFKNSYLCSLFAIACWNTVNEILYFSFQTAVDHDLIDFYNDNFDDDDDDW